ncbi:phospholipase D-like domain-containing protein [Allopontixanthobacter sp.]|uniref:phospholipase D-like domain-containing protein n=1 Tax=Allopontixanthobacter sp. TaxID=2906452 RepID=UPI002AB850A2|nr:phospholipase D-like domain-containing protein [Allopontixanthobacter sp.]MDZ4308708.1 phospholipase D-like domain-containing protein [Allopontixanthobacter sp.]
MQGDADGVDADVDASVEPGVWRYARAKRATVIIDAADYFRHMQQAMLAAQERILLIGWDFDTRIHLEQGRRWYQKGRRRIYPSRLGSFILWLSRHRKGLEIRILKWSYGALKFFSRGSMIVDLVRWWPHKRIDFKFDTNHPVGASHHQKIVVIDNHVAVCGGIDMTTRRWDTREHLEVNPLRKRPRGKVYGPWHDATMMIEGEAASALGDLAHDRWAMAGGPELKPVSEAAQQSNAWPDKLEAQFENVELGIARTRGEYGGQPQIDEIAALFERQIASAKDYIYAESQYFTSRRIGQAICERLARDNPPEILIVHAEHAEGWLEQQAMDHARAELIRTLGHIDKAGRFGLYVPYTGETPIYVHAKIMIIDDRLLRIGSANMNNRSMGLDSECDVFVDCERPGNDHCRVEVARLRHSLLAEHCGLEIEEVPGLLARHGSMAEMIRALGTGRNRTLRRFELPELNEVQEVLAESSILDPETPEELFEPYAHGGIFRDGSLLGRIRSKVKKRKT